MTEISKSYFTKEKLISDLKSLGVMKGDILNVKASLRSIGLIEGGANSLIDALIECVGQEGTIITDSFIESHSKISLSFWNNVVSNLTPSYAGALANAMIKYKSSVRSKHPIQKFCLIGKHATYLANDHTSEKSAYEVLKKIAAMGGKNLKIGSDKKVIGVGTTHVAIVESKKRQLRPYLGVRFQSKDKQIKSFMINWSGACSRAIYELKNIYNTKPCHILSNGYVGNAPAKLTCMATTLSLEKEYLKLNSKEFLTCSNKDCSCHYTWEKIGKSPLKASLDFLLKFKFKKSIKAFYIALFYRYPF